MQFLNREEIIIKKTVKPKINEQSEIIKIKMDFQKKMVHLFFLQKEKKLQNIFLQFQL